MGSMDHIVTLDAVHAILLVSNSFYLVMVSICNKEI